MFSILGILGVLGVVVAASLAASRHRIATPDTDPGLALRTDDPRATRPHLIDRLGRPIMRDRAIEGVPDDVQGPVDYRREPFAQFPGAAPPVRPLRDRRFVPRTPLNYLARRGIQVVNRDGFVMNPLPPQAQPPPPPQAQPPPVVAPPMPAFGANVAPAA